MEKYLEILRANRKALVEVISGLSTEQFNLIPTGYNNNIIWNLGHIVAVSENLLYKNTSVDRPIQLFDRTLFQRNTKPENSFTENDINNIKEALLKTVSEYKKGFGIKDDTDIGWQNEKIVINEAGLQFLLLHESIHYRAILEMLDHINNS